MSAGGSSEHPTPDEAIEAGLYYFAREDYVAARRWWEYAMAIDPHNLRAYECLRILGRTVGAVADLSEPPAAPPVAAPVPIAEAPFEDVPFEDDEPLEPASPSAFDTWTRSAPEPVPQPRRPTTPPARAPSAPPPVRRASVVPARLPTSPPPAVSRRSAGEGTGDVRPGALEFDPLGFEAAWEGLEGEGQQWPRPSAPPSPSTDVEPPAQLEVSARDPEWEAMMRQIASGGIVTGPEAMLDPSGADLPPELGDRPTGDMLRISMTGDFLGVPPTGDLRRLGSGDLRRTGSSDLRRATGDIKRVALGDVNPLVTGDVKRTPTGDVKRAPTGDVALRLGTGDVKRTPTGDLKSSGDLRRMPSPADLKRTPTGDLKRTPTGDLKVSSGDLKRSPTGDLKRAATGDLKAMPATDLKRSTGDVRPAVAGDELGARADASISHFDDTVREIAHDPLEVFDAISQPPPPPPPASPPKAVYRSKIPEARTFELTPDERSSSAPGIAEPSPEEILGEEAPRRVARAQDFEMIVEEPEDIPAGEVNAMDYALSAFESGSEPAVFSVPPGAGDTPWDYGPAESSAVTLQQDSEIEAVADYSPRPSLEAAVVSQDLIRKATPSRPAKAGSMPPRASMVVGPDPATALDRARSRLLLHDFDGALALLESIPPNHPVFEDAKGVLAETRSHLEATYASKLGRLDASPRVVLSGQQLIWLNLNHRAGFMLSQIDGAVTYEDLISVSGMGRLEALRILATLVQEGVIQGS